MSRRSRPGYGSIITRLSSKSYTCAQPTSYLPQPLLYGTACRLITGRAHAQSACDILHALLCGMDCDDVERVLRDRSRKPEERRRVLAFAPYPGRYIICHDRGDISARRDGEALIALDTGERFSLHTEP